MNQQNKPQPQPAAPRSDGLWRRPDGGGMMKGEKPVTSKGRWRKLIQYLSVYWISIIVVMLFAIASTIFTIVGPKILGKATTKLFEGVMAQIAGTGAGIDFVYIGNILLLMVGLYLLSAMFSYIQGWIMSGVSAKITYRFRKDISAKDQPHAAAVF